MHKIFIILALVLSLGGCSVIRGVGGTIEAIGDGTATVVKGLGSGISQAVGGTGRAINQAASGKNGTIRGTVEETADADF